VIVKPRSHVSSPSVAGLKSSCPNPKPTCASNASAENFVKKTIHIRLHGIFLIQSLAPSAGAGYPINLDTRNVPKSGQYRNICCIVYHSRERGVKEIAIMPGKTENDSSSIVDLSKSEALRQRDNVCYRIGKIPERILLLKRFSD
jgi:hypothetical protein